MSDDWNDKDFWLGYHMGSSNHDDGGPGYRGPSPSLFKIVLGVIIFIVVFSLFFGLEIPGSVIELFIIILLFAGLISFGKK